MKLRSKTSRRLSAILAATLLVPVADAASAASPATDIRRDLTVAAIEKVMPSVVNIRTTELVRRNDLYETFFRRFYGLPDVPQMKEQPSGVGSGVIIDEVGDVAYILTNVHVVDRANRVQVQLWDGREYEAEKLLGTMQRDLALLRIVRRPNDPPFKPITLAKDDDLLLGETVIAVGNPFGLGGSVSRGILSSKNRRTDAGNLKLDYQDWLQTDADINPGNSGGPLINVRGELIGINVAVFSPDQGKGTGFAIPVKQVADALSDFFTLEWHARQWLGLRLRNTPQPLTVRHVQPGSPAERAGARVGQQIVEVNGRTVSGLAEFVQVVGASPDQRVALTVVEKSQRRVLNVELVSLAVLNRELLQRRLGLKTSTLSDAQAMSYQLVGGEGWLVDEVEGNSPAARARLEKGMVITAIDGVPVTNLVNLSDVLVSKKRGDTLQLTIRTHTRVNDRFVRLLTGQFDVVVR